MLDDQGIIIKQLGKAPSLIYSSKNIDNIIVSLEDVGMNFHQYEYVSTKRSS